MTTFGSHMDCADNKKPTVLFARIKPKATYSLREGVTLVNPSHKTVKITVLSNGIDTGNDACETEGATDGSIHIKQKDQST